MTAIRARLLPLLALVLALAAPGAAAAQAPPSPLEGFVGTVSRLWARGDASGLVELAAGDGRIVLDLGTDGAGEVQGRHVAAALRDLFGGRESVSVRPAQVTLSGGTPPRGFGELTWTSRPRGVSQTQTQTVYVGAEWDGRGWRLRELRLLR